MTDAWHGPRRREVLLQEIGFDDNTNGEVLDGSKEDCDTDFDGDKDLASCEAMRARSSAAIANCMALCIPGVQYIAKDV